MDEGRGGSSPRARGTPCCTAPRPRRAAVHPRVRGEHAGAACPLSRSAGSSPRARGTRFSNVRQDGLNRFIPACAGNTPRRTATHTAQSVHPRVRGEHVLEPTSLAGAAGSSPRARGTPAPCLLAQERRWFIPACAGNTVDEALPRLRDKVHPRVRGEHASSRMAYPSSIGSCPRARGTPRVRPNGAPGLRFIPACAGNTRSENSDAYRGTVHPRVRGEHLLVNSRTSLASGSSPRARGTQGGEPSDG